MKKQLSTVTQNLIDALPASSAPIYARLKSAIVNNIANAIWMPEQRLPSESEIVRALGVSRMTVNRALRELTADGVLSRQQGVGTFVAHKKSHSALFEVHNIAQEIADRGNKHSVNIVSLQSVKSNSDQALRLGVRTGEKIFESIIIHLENDTPIQLEERIVNAQLAPDYDQQDFSQLTPYVYLNKVAPISEGEHLVEAVSANVSEANMLNISTHQACLQIKRRTWSGKQIVTSARLLSPGHLFQLFGHFGPK
ncbi:MAG: histidine utilization repressor [Gammaproteobacteria bacterium]|nr:histidine utilization repressor [Gammaproteobacteria bacterium]